MFHQGSQNHLLRQAKATHAGWPKRLTLFDLIPNTNVFTYKALIGEMHKHTSIRLTIKKTLKLIVINNIVVQIGDCHCRSQTVSVILAIDIRHKIGWKRLT